MGSFFNGWRRKVGVATLVMALAVMGLWIRSCRMCDSVYCPVGNRAYVFVTSGYQTFLFGGAIASAIDQFPSPGWITYEDPEYEADIFAGCRWQIRFFGFGVGEKDPLPTGLLFHRIVVLPYWSLTIPLTLLSTYLILSKPRRSKSSDQPAISNPISN